MSRHNWFACAISSVSAGLRACSNALLMWSSMAIMELTLPSGQLSEVERFCRRDNLCRCDGPGVSLPAGKVQDDEERGGRFVGQVRDTLPTATTGSISGSYKFPCSPTELSCGAAIQFSGTTTATSGAGEPTFSVIQSGKNLISEGSIGFAAQGLRFGTWTVTAILSGNCPACGAVKCPTTISAAAPDQLMILDAAVDVANCKRSLKDGCVQPPQFAKSKRRGQDRLASVRASSEVVCRGCVVLDCLEQIERWATFSELPAVAAPVGSEDSVKTIVIRALEAFEFLVHPSYQ